MKVCEPRLTGRCCASVCVSDVAKCAKKAHKEGKTLKEATVELGLLTPEVRLLCSV